MYRHLEHRLAQRVLECLQLRYPGAALPGVVIEQPPKVELGDFAIPTFPFAKPLRSAPLKIAEAIRTEIGSIEGIAEMQVAPPGYLNVKIDRAWMAAALAADARLAAEIRSRQDSGRALQHQSQQGRPHRPSAQRHSRRYLRPASALSGQSSGHSELHRQHGSPGRRRGRRLHSHREEISRRDRGPDPATTLRLLLLGSICASLEVVRNRTN